ncbi:unnamed protein product, partial [Sphenostylis stenocarpa]
ACPSSNRRSSGLYLEAGKIWGLQLPPFIRSGRLLALRVGMIGGGKGVDPLARLPFERPSCGD